MAAPRPARGSCPRASRNRVRFRRWRAPSLRPRPGSCRPSARFPGRAGRAPRIGPRALDAFGICDAAAEHLESAAEAEQPTARRRWAWMSICQPSARTLPGRPRWPWEPGRTTRSASPGRAWPRGTKVTSTSGSAISGSRSSKLAMREKTGTAILMVPRSRPLPGAPPPGAPPPARPRPAAAGVLEVRHHAEGRQAGHLFDNRQAFIEKAKIAAEIY